MGKIFQGMRNTTFYDEVFRSRCFAVNHLLYCAIKQKPFVCVSNKCRDMKQRVTERVYFVDSDALVEMMWAHAF